MIRALVEQTFDASKKYLVLAGLSTDSKPTTGIVTGSKFIEVDTGTNYAFDEVSGTWSAATITMQDIKDEIDSWLENNIDPDSGYALDRTLSLENAAAPADMVGDLKSAFNAYVLPVNNALSYSQNGAYVYEYKIIVGHTYILKNTSNSASLVAQTKADDKTTTIETITDGLNAGNSVEFAPSTNANYIRVYTNAVGSWEIADKGTTKFLVDNEVIPELQDHENDLLKIIHEQSHAGNGSFTTQYIIKSGNKYLLTNTSESATLLAQTKADDETTTIETITSDLSPGKSIEFTATQNANYIRVYTNAEGSWKIEDEGTINCRVNVLEPKVAECENASIKNENIELDNWLKGYAYNTAVSVGDTVSLEPYSSSFWSMNIDVEVGDEFIITGKGGSTPRLWCFIDTDNKAISVAGASTEATNLHLIASEKGKLIVNVNSSNTRIIKKKVISTALSELDVVEKKCSTDTDYVNFDFDFTLQDVSADRALVDFSPAGQYTVMPQLYALFDELCSAYSDYISKYDAANMVSLSYPAYADYYTYMYKLICSNIGAGNETYIKKKKLFIIGGVHGNEFVAPFNLYMLAKRLCTCSDENYFKLRSAFDIYILPCLNGYGMNHKQRGNYNGVNINRNFPITYFVVDGYDTKDDPNLCNYTGAYGGSEFETQLVMALTELIEPDIVIDHHNYDVEARQFYAVVQKEAFMPIVHKCLVDCSIAFTKHLPAYFGSGYQLVVSDTYANAPRVLGSNASGTVTRWMYEHGVEFEATVEVSECINYLNGSISSAENDWLGNDAMSVCEYTLRDQILHYCQYILKKC